MATLLTSSEPTTDFPCSIHPDIIPCASALNQTVTAGLPLKSKSYPPRVAVLVINLDHSTARLAATQRQLDRLELPFHRIPAVDGANLSAVERAKFYSPDLNRKQFHKTLSNGEIGCYISHLRAWQWVLDHEVDQALILEDDVVFGAELVEALALLEQLPPGWDLIKLGSFSRKAIISRSQIGAFDLCQYQKPPISAFAQVVSRRGAERLLGTRIPFGRPVDVDLQHKWETGLEVLGLEPYPVRICPDLSSDIDRVNQRRQVVSRRFSCVWQRARFLVNLSVDNQRRYGFRSLTTN